MFADLGHFDDSPMMSRQLLLTHLGVLPNKRGP